MKPTLENLNTKHIVPFPYNPQSNDKVERFHCVLEDTQEKLAVEEKGKLESIPETGYKSNKVFNKLIKFLPTFCSLGEIWYYPQIIYWNPVGNIWENIFTR